MRRTDPARLVLAAFRFFGVAPEWLSRAICVVAGDLLWLLHGSGVRQLEANLRVARPSASRRELRRLSRAGVRTYLRYFAEAFALPRLTPAQIDARVRAVGAEPLREECARGRAVVLVLGHQGNWDLAGAWASACIAPATTVAERLEPPEVYDEFLHMREAVGMSIIPLDAGQDVFRQLVRVIRGGNALVPLVSDRDLTSRGVEVELLGERARVAAGPAALAIATGAMVTPATIRHERLRGARRRAAGTPWGIVVTFHPHLQSVAGMPRGEQVQALTQAWVDVLGADITRYPTHWHMMQKVFVAHLDPARYAATLAKAEGES